MSDDINNTAPRTDIPGSMDWGEGDLPEQMGAGLPTLMPAQDTFKLPANLAQLWSDQTINDPRPTLPNGQANPTYGQPVIRKKLKFDKNNPLVVVGGTHDGMPMVATFTTNPRPRGKKDDPKTPWISDLAYLLEVSLGDKSRPKTPEALVAQINRYAGKTIRLEHGLSGQCRPDKVRYIAVQVTENGQVVEHTIQDPNGTKGCGERYYTRDFKDPDTNTYDEEVQCACGALVRGFPSVDRFLPPLGR